MDPTRSLGTKLKISNNTVGNLTSIGGIEASAETIDVTALDSKGGYRKFLAGFKDGGEVGISGWFVPADTGQADMYAAFESGNTCPFVIEFPASLGASWVFDGVVTGFSTSAELEDAITFEGTIKVSGEPTLAFSGSAGLTALTLTGAGGTLSPAFDNGRYLYTFAGVTATSVTITATAATHALKLYADGVFVSNLTSGAASAAIPLALNTVKKLAVHASENGKAPKVYEVIVIKTS